MMSSMELLAIYRFLKSNSNSAKSIQELKHQFPGVVDLRNLLQSKSSLFWIAKINENDWIIRAKVPVSLCYLYLNGTCAGNCQCWHICKDYLLSNKYCDSLLCKYGFSHDISDPHNKLISSRYWVDDISTLRSSFPRLCTNFVKNGTCDQLFCGYLHMCPESIRNCCVGKCVLAKESGLSKGELHNFGSEHNKTVLDIFELSFQKNDRQNLIANILIRKINTDLSPFVASSDISSQISVTQSTPVQCNTLPKKLTVLICTYYLNGECKNMLCPRLHFCKEFLIDASKCSVENCKFGFSHDPLDNNNKEIMIKHGVSHLSQGELVNMLRNSFPRVCKNYQSDKDCSNNQCQRIHICKTYAFGECISDGCVKSHDLKDSHNIGVLKEFSLDRITGNKNVKQKYFILSNIMFSKDAKAGFRDSSSIKSGQFAFCYLYYQIHIDICR